LQGKRVVILCGSGNNGGDGLVAALHLAQKGADVRVFLAAVRKKDDPRSKAIIAAGINPVDAQVESGREALAASLYDADVFVDAVLGTGVSLPVRPPVSTTLGYAKNILGRLISRPYIVAVDCPSGLDCDSGEADRETIPADLTITLGAAKAGLIKFPGAEFTGELLVASIGLPPKMESMPDTGPWLATPDLLAQWLPPRPRDSHKGSFGRVLVIGGSINYPGAPVLAGQGAYRSGSGLVTIAVPEPVFAAVVPLLPEATWIVLPDDLGVIAQAAVEVLQSKLAAYDSIVIGPGFGREKTTAAFLKSLLQQELGIKTPIGFGPTEKASVDKLGKRPPMIVDADALKMLVDIRNWPVMLPPGSVLTPHPGEMSVLTGLPRNDIQADRTGVALRYAKEWNHVVVLKGAFTVVAWPDGTTIIEPFATPALARAGTGDVLAGMIAGLIGQGMKSGQAAVLGAYLHGRAGEIAAREVHASDSVVATDVVHAIGCAIAELRRG
jgi:NAD(P)H-hydrate epimerase